MKRINLDPFLIQYAKISTKGIKTNAKAKSIKHLEENSFEKFFNLPLGNIALCDTKSTKDDKEKEKNIYLTPLKLETCVSKEYQENEKVVHTRGEYTCKLYI